MMSFKGSLSKTLEKNDLVNNLITFVTFPFAAKYAVSEEQQR